MQWSEYCRAQASQRNKIISPTATTLMLEVKVIHDFLKDF